MRRETAVTIVLVLMILISILMSWNIVTNNFKITNNYIEKSSSYDYSFTFNKKSEIADVVAAAGAIIHTSNDEHFLTYDDELIKDSYNRILELNVGDYSQNVFSKSVSKQLYNKPGLEFTFFASIPLELINLKVIEEKTFNNFLLNRIFISETDGKIYFFQANESKYIVAKINSENTSNYTELYSNNSDKFLACNALILEKNIVYLPKDEITIPERNFVIKTFDINKFETLFFGKSVVQKSSDDNTHKITNGKGLLTVYDDKIVFSYVRPNLNDEKLDEHYFTIKRNVDFINSHSGWDNYYRYAGLSENKNYLSFQMYVNNMPVFNKDGRSELKVNYTDNNLIFYMRPYFYFYSDLEVKSSITLPNYKDVLEIFSNNTNFENRKLTDMLIGYTMVFDEQESSVVTLSPAWYINYGGVWTEFTKIS